MVPNCNYREGVLIFTSSLKYFFVNFYYIFFSCILCVRASVATSNFIPRIKKKSHIYSILSLMILVVPIGGGTANFWNHFVPPPLGAGTNQADGVSLESGFISSYFTFKI